jgi:hypothetical protein
LKKVDIVFMANVSIHPVDGVEEAIEARGDALSTSSLQPRLQSNDSLRSRIISAIGGIASSAPFESVLVRIERFFFECVKAGQADGTIRRLSLLKTVETSRKPQFPRAAPVPSGGMVTILFALVSLFAFRFRSRASLELELVALRHQVIVLRRQRPHRLRLLSAERLLWVWLI